MVAEFGYDAAKLAQFADDEGLVKLREMRDVTRQATAFAVLCGKGE
jgi:hypothetical protein